MAIAYALMLLAVFLVGVAIGILVVEALDPWPGGAGPIDRVDVDRERTWVACYECGVHIEKDQAKARPVFGWRRFEERAWRPGKPKPPRFYCHVHEPKWDVVVWSQWGERLYELVEVDDSGRRVEDVRRASVFAELCRAAKAKRRKAKRKRGGAK